MSRYILLFMILALSAFDVWFTERKIRKDGIDSELSYTIREFVKVLGVRKGIVFGMTAWRAPVVAFLLYKNWLLPLAFYVGFAANHAFAQVFVLLQQHSKTGHFDA